MALSFALAFHLCFSLKISCWSMVILAFMAHLARSLISCTQEELRFWKVLSWQVNHIQENWTPPPLHQKKVYKAYITLSKGNITKPECCFNETPQDSRETTEVAFLTFVKGLKTASWKTADSAQPLPSWGLVEWPPPSKICREWNQIAVSLPSWERRHRRVLGTRIWDPHTLRQQEFWDFLVYCSSL